MTLHYRLYIHAYGLLVEIVKATHNRIIPYLELCSKYNKLSCKREPMGSVSCNLAVDLDYRVGVVIFNSWPSFMKLVPYRYRYTVA